MICPRHHARRAEQHSEKKEAEEDERKRKHERSETPAPAAKRSGVRD